MAQPFTESDAERLTTLWIEREQKLKVGKSRGLKGLFRSLINFLKGGE